MHSQHWRPEAPHCESSQLPDATTRKWFAASFSLHQFPGQGLSFDRPETTTQPAILFWEPDKVALHALKQLEGCVCVFMPQRTNSKCKNLGKPCRAFSSATQGEAFSLQPYNVTDCMQVIQAFGKLSELASKAVNPSSQKPRASARPTGL